MEFKVSIIIPVFNRGNLILETLKSIEVQTYSNWECLIIDDRSLDSTWKIVDSFIKNRPKFSLHTRPRFLPKGATSCRNIGFDLSKGEFIQWFDSDDLMLPSMLEEKLNFLNLNPDLDFVVSKMDNFEDGQVIVKEYSLESEDLIFDYIKNKVCFLTPGPLFRKSFLLNKRLFNINLRRHQESEFYFRLLLTQPNYKSINKSLALRRIHSNSIISMTSERKEKYFFYILLKNYLISIYKLNLKVWNTKLFIYFLKWSKSSIKFFIKFWDFRFLFFGFQLFIYSLFINWKSKFQ